MNDEDKLKKIIEGLLLAAGKPLNLDQMLNIFTEDEAPTKESLKEVIEVITQECEGRGFELKKVASGYRFQVKQEVSEWVGRLWDEKPQRYSRALLETIAIIAYRQPLTRGDIEKVRGVAVSTTIMRTLLDREWVRVVGHRDVPGRPAMYATTRQFLDYFNLENLDELPALAEIREFGEVDKALNQELSLDEQVADKLKVLELPEGESDEPEFDVMDEQGEAAVAWATQPLNVILGENEGGEKESSENEEDVSEDSVVTNSQNEGESLEGGADNGDEAHENSEQQEETFEGSESDSEALEDEQNKVNTEQ